MAIIPRVQEDGRTLYDVQVTVDRRNVIRRAKNLQAARKLETKLKNEVDQGAVPDGRLTVGQLLDKWVAMHSTGENPDWSVNTTYGYERIIEGWLRPAFGKKRVDKLTGMDLDDLYTKMREQGMSSGRIHNVHSCIRTALNQARKWKKVAYNVAQDATPGQVIRQQGAVATETEVDQLMAALERIEKEAAGHGDRRCQLEGCESQHYGRGFCLAHWKDWRYRGFHKDQVLAQKRGGVPRGLRTDGVRRMKVGLLIAAETGIRRGELAGVDWADFDWRNNRVTIRRATADAGGRIVAQQTKTHATREIPLSVETVAVLKEHRGIGSVCGMTPRQLSTWWDYLCEEAGIEPLPEAGDGRKRRQQKIGWHSLRHRLLTNLAEACGDLTGVAYVAGHSTTRTTEQYMHRKRERGVAAMEALVKKRAQ